jgi:3-mercaptopyruvate sulfurtransferase SseA
MLIDRGFKLVRPLEGGLEAWARAGYPIAAEPLITIQATGSYERASIDQLRK